MVFRMELTYDEVIDLLDTKCYRIVYWIYSTSKRL